MIRDRTAVVWTRSGTAPIKMGHFSVTDTECRFTYETDFVNSGLPGLGVLYAPEFIQKNTIRWKRSVYFDLIPQLQTLIPPASEANFQRKLVLSYLSQQNRTPESGFDTDWALLMLAGHGGIGHLDVFENDEQAQVWYGEDIPSPLFHINENFGFSLKEFMTWFDNDAHVLLEALGPTPSVGGAIPKLLLSIPDSGWDGRISLPTRKKIEGRTDVVLKFERPNYPGIVELESLTLNLHAKAGFDVPRHWVTEINGMPALAVERYDRDTQGKPVFTESIYSVLATGDSRITHHYSSSYDHIGYAIDRSPIPIVTEPMQSKQHLLKRLLISFLTGNGDLHLENLSLIQTENEIHFSPVYDPTPMRAYSQHDMLCVMPFGHYGEYDKTDKLIGYDDALRRLIKNLSIKKYIFKSILEETLAVTVDYPEQIKNLNILPMQNSQHLIKIIQTERQRLTKLLQNL